ncbi:GNAT family N-acetyltransferase [Ottowia thiooxydans]|uniref:GNAT family N-acetyltransferase n=1 Tax=Ottowia thiooxydans TaxID=219182 RepID=UPI00339AC559
MPQRPRLRTQLIDTPSGVHAQEWDALLARQAMPTPFMRHAYLSAMHESDSAVPRTGWALRFMLLWDGDELAAACPLYAKSHSYGEYVFDWAWANAYAEHGLQYYPKALVAVPFTPVPGSRLLARDASSREALVRALIAWCTEQELSSLHVLFGDEADRAACDAVGLLERHQVQFHWKNTVPGLAQAPDIVSSTDRPFRDFDDFLAQLTQEKRKKIRQERRKVRDAGVSFRWAQGADISAEDWAFFYRCYERTYLEHGNPPYLTPEFFAAMAGTMAENWVLFVAERDGQPMAVSLIGVNRGTAREGAESRHPSVAYGRYWGALERVDSLHFEACYYQPIEWCIAHGFDSFEGGAQGEHKMARALMPVQTHSAHWLAHPAFSDAVERFLEREGAGVENYLEHLQERSPFRRTGPTPDGPAV